MSKETENSKKTENSKEKPLAWKSLAKFLFVAIIAFIAIPLIIYFLCNNHEFKIKLIEFYFSALSILVTAGSVFVAYIVVQKQIQSDKNLFQEEMENNKKLFKEEVKRNERTLIDNTFFNLYDIYNNMLASKESELKSLYRILKDNLARLDKEASEKSAKKYYYEIVKTQFDTLLTSVDNENELKYCDVKVFVSELPNDILRGDIHLLDSSSKIMRKCLLEDSFYRICEDEVESYLEIPLFNQLGINSDSDPKNPYPSFEDFYQSRSWYKNSTNEHFLKSIFEIMDDYVKQSEHGEDIYSDDFKNNLTATVVSKICNQLDIHTKLLETAERVSKEIKDKYQKKYQEVRAELKNEIIEKTFANSFPETGDFFRYFYRILKYLEKNKELIDDDQFRNYIGFLRGVTDEVVMFLLYYNSAHVKAGQNMKEMLIKTKFFGGEDKLESTGGVLERHIYFTNTTLIDQKDDLQGLSDIITDSQNKKET